MNSAILQNDFFTVAENAQKGLKMHLYTVVAACRGQQGNVLLNVFYSPLHGTNFHTLHP